LAQSHCPSKNRHQATVIFKTARVTAAIGAEERTAWLWMKAKQRADVGSLVSVPIKAYASASSTAAISHFHLLHANCGQRIEYRGWLAGPGLAAKKFARSSCTLGRKR
jgi:hypothetical protein